MSWMAENLHRRFFKLSPQDGSATAESSGAHRTAQSTLKLIYMIVFAVLIYMQGSGILTDCIKVLT